MKPLETESDRLYARGEISREEWIVRRSTGSRDSNGARRRATWIAAATVTVVAIAAILVLGSLASFGGPVTGPSSGSIEQLSPAELNALNASATPGLAYAANDTLWMPSGPIHLVVYAAPAGHGMQFVIQGLVDPTVHASAGWLMTVSVVNLDSSSDHGWALSPTGPPFPNSSMMGNNSAMTNDSTTGSGMMGNNGMMGYNSMRGYDGPMMSVLSPASSSGYWGQTATYTLTSGNYWYYCDYSGSQCEDAGNSAPGMYGSLSVR